MKRKKLIYGLAVIIALGLWAAFRPERLFVNAKVNEAMPSGTGNLSQTVLAQVLASGKFHDVAHKGVGQATIYQLGGENGCSGLATSKRRMALTCAFTSSPRKMPATARL